MGRIPRQTLALFSTGLQAKSPVWKSTRTAEKAEEARRSQNLREITATANIVTHLRAFSSPNSTITDLTAAGETGAVLMDMSRGYGTYKRHGFCTDRFVVSYRTVLFIQS